MLSDLIRTKVSQKIRHFNHAMLCSYYLYPEHRKICTKSVIRANKLLYANTYYIKFKDYKIIQIFYTSKKIINYVIR